MRIDKYLKVSRIIKRRTIAKEFLDNGLILINGKVAKASSDININNIIEIKRNNKIEKYKVINIFDYATEEKAKTMYEVIEK